MTQQVEDETIGFEDTPVIIGLIRTVHRDDERSGGKIHFRG
jgi:hypothetical protein